MRCDLQYVMLVAVLVEVVEVERFVLVEVVEVERFVLVL